MSSSREVKVVLVGDASVGKTSVALRYVVNTFRQDVESTIGASFLSKTVVVDGIANKLQIWDTAGEEKYKSMAPIYYRNAAVAILVFDLTSQPTFESVKGWVEELRTQGPEGLMICLAANKSDKEGREVDAGSIKEFAETIDALSFEVSAKTGGNVVEMFQIVCRELHKRRPSRTISMVSDSATVSLDNSSHPVGKGKKKCC